VCDSIIEKRPSKTRKQPDVVESEDAYVGTKYLKVSLHCSRLNQVAAEITRNIKPLKWLINSRRCPAMNSF